MYRLFPAFLAFFVLTVVAATASQAAEPSADFGILAQVPHMTRGPGMYLNLFKFIPVVIIYLLWAWTTNWVEHDTKELNNLDSPSGTVRSSSPACWGWRWCWPFRSISSGWASCCWRISFPCCRTSMPAIRRCPTTRKC